MPTLDWIGKDAVIRHHKEVPFRLLEPDEKLSHGGAETGNLIVQGDNLHALKALLPKYAGKVKCIYIDPPYNTGNEGWVYNDNVNSPEINRWFGSVVGKEAEDLSRHDKWLCMMYPRMVLLKQFLTEDGVLVVHIDENESATLLLLLDEVFGRSNRLGEIVWDKGNPKGDSTKIAYQHETIVCYARSVNALQSLGKAFHSKKPNAEAILRKARTLFKKIGKELLPPDLDAVVKKYDLEKSSFNQFISIYRQSDAVADLKIFCETTPGLKGGEKLYFRLTADGRVYRLISMQWPNKKKAPSEYFEPITDPDTGISYAAPAKGWRYPPKTVAELLSRKLIEFPASGETQPQKMIFLDDNMTDRISSILRFGGSDESLFNDLGIVFDFQKPVTFARNLITVFAPDKDSIILDSFAGSGTTGHAVLKQNAEDGGTRKFILVEMEEKIAQDITAERVRRVVGGYTNAKGERVEGLGGGFQFCRLSEEPLFNEFGDIRDDVTFAQLADFVWFAETGVGYTGKADSPLLGAHGGVAVYLLFNGILGDRRPAGGNILTPEILASLPEHDGLRVIYAAAVKGIGPAALARANIVFKQTPYAIEV